MTNRFEVRMKSMLVCSQAMTIGDELSWSEHGANSARAVGSVPVWAINLRVGLSDLAGPFQVRIFCYSINVKKVDCSLISSVYFLTAENS